LQRLKVRPETLTRKMRQAGDADAKKSVTISIWTKISFARIGPENSR
jgi:hypothetical protein